MINNYWKTIDELKSYLNRIDYKFFLTLHLTPVLELSNPNKCFEQIVRTMNKKLNGRNYHKHNRLLQFFAVKESGLSKNPHYHLLLKKTNDLSVSKLTKTIIHISNLYQFRNILKPITDTHEAIKNITTNYFS